MRTLSCYFLAGAFLVGLTVGCSKAPPTQAPDGSKAGDTPPVMVGGKKSGKPQPSLPPPPPAPPPK